MKIKVLCLAGLLFFIGSVTTQAASYNDSNCDWCELHWPSSSTVDATLDIYGHIYVAGITDVKADPTLIFAEVGYGPHLSNPIDNDSAWTWETAVYNPYGHVAPNDYEYMGKLSFTDPGTFSYTFRFSLDSGITWTVTDMDGNYNGVQVDQLGVATVLTGTGSPVPLPGAIWMFGAGMFGIFGFRKGLR